MTQSTLARILAAPRTDVFGDDAPLGPLTWGDKLDAETAFAAHFVELASAGCKTANEVAAAREMGASAAVFTMKFGAPQFNQMAYTAWGAEQLIYISLKSVNKKTATTRQQARDLLNKFNVNIQDVIDWLLEVGTYAPKLVAPEQTALSPDGPKSVA